MNIKRSVVASVPLHGRDPLSASSKQVRRSPREGCERLICLAKSEGITLLSTSLLQALNRCRRDARADSTIADTWIHLTNISQAGERIGALSIVKSRAYETLQSVRELV